MGGPSEILISATASNGTVKHYGPYYSNQESIASSTILGNDPDGNYTIVMTGQTNTGLNVRKESSVQLSRPNVTIVKGLKYSIVFSFDRATTIASYSDFLTNKVAPLITDGSSVIIHGHTDIIGLATYNQTLSENRAEQTQTILKRALDASGKRDVKFEASGFGADASHSPFGNDLPEERFYNRTVIIDIVPLSK